MYWINCDPILKALCQKMTNDYRHDRDYSNARDASNFFRVSFYIDHFIPIRHETKIIFFWDQLPTKILLRGRINNR